MFDFERLANAIKASGVRKDSVKSILKWLHTKNLTELDKLWQQFVLKTRT